MPLTITLSNHAKPIFALWQDADWHYRTNTYLKAIAFKCAP